MQITEVQFNALDIAVLQETMHVFLAKRTVEIFAIMLDNNGPVSFIVVDTTLKEFITNDYNGAHGAKDDEIEKRSYFHHSSYNDARKHVVLAVLAEPRVTSI